MLEAGVTLPVPPRKVKKMFQPPLSIGSLLARRCTTVPQSSDW